MIDLIRLGNKIKILPYIMPEGKTSIIKFKDLPSEKQYHYIKVMDFIRKNLKELHDIYGKRSLKQYYCMFADKKLNIYG